MFAAITLAQLLNSCAPNVGRRTMAAIVRVESGGNALLLHDNTIDRSFEARDTVEAIAWASQLLRLGHSVDLGISQINSANLPRLGLSIREAFNPCDNVHAGAVILSSDYHSAAAQFGEGQYALRRAIGAYNTGSLYAGYAYIAKILNAAGLAADDDFRVPDLRGASLQQATRIRVTGIASQKLTTRPHVTPADPRSNPYASPILVGVPSTPRAHTASLARVTRKPEQHSISPELAPILAQTRGSFPVTALTPSPATATASPSAAPSALVASPAPGNPSPH